ncbi:MAG: DUF4101 domain-containing protein [Cyanobium sp. PLM2.Bin73]|nr:MAG: DUF4101 domain-containing protein [Cyanobium sp. PLM2.Bin73]
MDLPIDHFRLLGVNPNTDLPSVLRIAAQRIDRPPEQGFTPDTLQARADLLRSSADLLTDPQRRAHYESELTALSASGESLQAALDVPTSKEVAGLLLLLEAGLPLDCFELASRALQPPQAPALGSGREADLSLLAGLACLEAAAELRQERRYEAAAQVLSQGNQLLQRMGQHGDLRQRMASERRTLRPYRVLDLLSRDLGSSQERSDGLALLEELVAERGGLDGHGDPELSAEEFQAFFRQIRAYLTVQEQIDLFERWAPQSAKADFLAATALTALGFAQRKPERIAAARSRLLMHDRPELKPLLACLNLLLGQVDSAEFQFAEGASKEIKQWAARQSDDPLAQVCAYCRDWLARDVLPGYRDLEADADMEAYFADRDVQAYVDGLEPTPEAASPLSSLSPEGGARGQPLFGAGLRSPFALAGAALPGAQALLGFGPLGEEPDHPDGDLADEDDDEELDGAVGGLAGRAGRAGRWRRPGLMLAAAGATALVAGGLITLLRPRPALVEGEPAAELNGGGGDNAPADAAPTATNGEAPAPAPPATTAAAAGIPLRSAEPSAAEIQTLLETWLTAKATVLAGDEPTAKLEDLAQDGQLRQLQAERRSDQARNHTQRIDTSVEALRLEASSPQRVAAVASIRYRGERRDSQGQGVGQPSNLTLRNRYVFSREGGTWRLVSFERVN